LAHARRHFWIDELLCVTDYGKGCDIFWNRVIYFLY
jgi:hypothetical protein